MECSGPLYIAAPSRRFLALAPIKVRADGVVPEWACSKSAYRQAGMRLDYKNSAHSGYCSVLTNRIVKKTSFSRSSVQAGSRQPGLAQRMRNLMPTNAETVSRRPEIVIVGHNQCQAEPVSSPRRFPRHQSDRFRNSTLMTGESTGGRHWLTKVKPF